MSISLKEKNEIFSFIKSKFNWCSLEFFTEENFYYAFNNKGLADDGFSFRSGCSKYCIFHPFFEDYVVKFSPNGFDYCEREYKNYWAAVYNHVEEYFPYTIFLGEINGVKMYLQERAICDSESISEIWYNTIYEGYWSEEDAKEAAETGEIWSIIDDLDDYDRVECLYSDSKLWDFLEEYRINDLHEGNFGYIGEKLVIIDFSGYGFLWRVENFKE